MEKIDRTALIQVLKENGIKFTDIFNNCISVASREIDITCPLYCHNMETLLMAVYEEGIREGMIRKTDQIKKTLELD